MADKKDSEKEKKHTHKTEPKKEHKPEHKAEKPDKKKEKPEEPRLNEKTEEDLEEEIEEEAKDYVVIKRMENFGGRRKPEEVSFHWTPKTNLGRDVAQGKYKSLKDILAKGEIILEPEIVDYLVPGIKEEVMYIGGTPGKGGGSRRTPTRMTARMHKSGRRFKVSALVAVGNSEGLIGLGKASSMEHRTAIEKAVQQAKLNMIIVKRGCGSWECNCGGNHSIQFKTSGKTGSVKVSLLPTPTGIGIVADDEMKKMIRLAGIKDLWIKTDGMTSTRTNLTYAMFDALRNLGMKKGDF
jgi:small subunit ribosomal protein S5